MIKGLETAAECGGPDEMISLAYDWRDRRNEARLELWNCEPPDGLAAARVIKG